MESSPYPGTIREVDVTKDVDDFVAKTVGNIAGLLRDDEVREPHCSVRARAVFNACKHGGKIMRQSTKANGESPRDGDCVWVCKDVQGAKNHSVLPQSVVVDTRRRKVGGSLEYKVAMNLPFGLVYLEEWLDETHVFKCAPGVTPQSIGLAGAMSRWQHQAAGQEIVQFKYRVVVDSLKTYAAKAKQTRKGCKCRKTTPYNPYMKPGSRPVASYF